jgi:hypothetical protein
MERLAGQRDTRPEEPLTTEPSCLLPYIEASLYTNTSHLSYLLILPTLSSSRSRDRQVTRITGYTIVPSTAASGAATATASAVCTVTNTTTKTVINTFKVTRNVTCSAKVVAITARFQSSAATNSSSVSPRLLPGVAHLYENQTKIGGLFSKCSVNMEPLTVAMIGLATAGGVLYLSKKVKKIFWEAPAGERPRS